MAGPGPHGAKARWRPRQHPIGSTYDNVCAAEPRVLVFSQRNIDTQVWHGSQYEFEDVIAEVDDAHLLAPPAGGGPFLLRAGQWTINEARHRSGRKRTSTVPRTRVEGDYDLFFGVFHFASELAHLERMRGWQERCRKKVAFIIELWAPWFSRQREYLELLEDFDQVFVFARWALPELHRLTGARCDYLATATDALRFVPVERQPERSIDVYTYGRRNVASHQNLLRLMEMDGLHYSFQSITGAFSLIDYVDHRMLSASNMQRSRYTVVYKMNDNDDRLERTGGEEALTSRYFEALATGTFMLGSAADTPDFTDAFDWPDAIVEVPGDADWRAVLDDLDTQPERIAAARMLAEHGVVHAEVIIRSAFSPDELAAGLARRRLMPALIVGNKNDVPGAGDALALLRAHYAGYVAVDVNFLDEANFDQLKTSIFDILGLVRVYVLERPTADAPRTAVILPRSSSIGDVVDKVRSARNEQAPVVRAWGPSVKYPGQSVALRPGPV